MNSKEEKLKSFKENRYIERWVFVQELINMLSTLRPDDWVTPNQIGNFTISREDIGYIGYIDLHTNEVVILPDDEIELYNYKKESE